MHKNPLYRAWLLIVICAALWYTGIGLYRFHNYSLLTKKAPLLSSEWQIQEAGSEQFYAKAAYLFSVDQKTFKGSTEWPKETYRNRFALEQDLPHLKKQHNAAWYSPADPHYSSLQKNFPIKEWISAIFLWGLCLYFFWLGFYVNQFKH